MKLLRALWLALAGLPVSLSANTVLAGPAESAPVSSRSIVIVADLSTDETENAKLRAALYELARGRGLEPMIRADVRGAAENLGVMRAGQITADEAELDRLRAAVGAGLLGRVSKDGTGVKVTLVSGRGAQSRNVQAPLEAAQAPVQTAFGELLDAIAPAPAAPVVKEEPLEPTHRVVAGGLVLPDEERPRQWSAAQEQEAWERRGGVKPMFGASILATAQQHRNVGFDSTNPFTGGVEAGSEDANGIGGGVGARLALWYMSLPDPVTSGNVFPAFRLGLGLDSNFLYVRYPVGFSYPNNTTRDTSYEDRGYWIVNLPLQLGVHVGFGKFVSQETWRGAVVGVAYSPSLQFELYMNETEGDFRFNPYGLELDVDIATINATETTDTQIRLMLYGLYPKDDEHPGLLTGGLGVAFY